MCPVFLCFHLFQQCALFSYVSIYFNNVPCFLMFPSISTTCPVFLCFHLFQQRALFSYVSIYFTFSEHTLPYIVINQTSLNIGSSVENDNLGQEEG